MQMRAGVGGVVRRRMASVVLAVIAMGMVLAASREASAQPSRTTQGWFLRNATAIRYNPLGLFNETRAGYRRRLFSADQSMFLNTFVAVGAQLSLSPAFIRGGVAVEIQPLSILNLYAVYEGGGMFGTFGLAQSFPSASTTYSDDEINRLRDLPAGDPRKNYSTTTHQLQLGALFQIRLGDLIARSNNRFVYQHIGIRSGDRVFYDQYWDILFPEDGWIYVNDVDLLYEPIPNLRIGVRYNVTHAFYRDDHFAPGENIAPTVNSTTHRIGPLAAFTFYEHRHGVFNAPTLALVLNWYLQHPYRAGGRAPGAISQAIPYIGAAFSFRIDP